MTLYRAVSDVEWRQTVQSAKLQTMPGAMEGKWFAESIDDARSWGTWFTGITGIPHDKILVVTISDRAAARLFRLVMLDNIGPARFADAGELGEFKIVEVTT